MRTNSKHSKQPVTNNQNGNSSKRSGSPFAQVYPINPVNNNKSTSNKKIISYSPYAKTIKQFQSHGKSAKKKNQQTDKYKHRQQREKSKHNKFRIVTEPVDDRIIHLAQGNMFNSSLALRNPSAYNVNSKKKIETEVRQSSQGIRLNLKQQNSYPSRSKQRIYSNPNNAEQHNSAHTNYQISRSGQGLYSRKNIEEQLLSDAGYDLKCPNCVRYSYQLDYINSQIKQMIRAKEQWKTGNAAYEQIMHIFRDVQGNFRNTSEQQYSKSKGDKKSKHKIPAPVFKFADRLIKQLKCNFSDLIRDIEALSSIDYPKMLSMDIFIHEPLYNQVPDAQQNELKQLLGQLRSTVEGKITDYDTYDTQGQNTYTKMIMRNMKARLSNVLRENLQLRIRKAILEKSEEISEESEDYLKAVIAEVLDDYVRKPKF